MVLIFSWLFPTSFKDLLDTNDTINCRIWKSGLCPLSKWSRSALGFDGLLFALPYKFQRDPPDTATQVLQSKHLASFVVTCLRFLSGCITRISIFGRCQEFELATHSTWKLYIAFNGIGVSTWTFSIIRCRPKNHLDSSGMHTTLPYIATIMAGSSAHSFRSAKCSLILLHRRQVSFLLIINSF